MKKLMTLLLITMHFSVHAQKLTQTLRGTVKDLDGQFMLAGANITIIQNGTMQGTLSDAGGQFRIDNIALGRIDVKVSYVGYQDKVFSNLELISGKELILDVSLQESLVQMKEIVVKVQKQKGEVGNDLSLISARSVTVDETHRYAGSFNDPARMVSSFAGVTANPSGDNDIVVRGNSPKYIQWRLEGFEMSNPNHFGQIGATGGPISALNSNLLANSDFYTGAFSPEYGNVLSGVFDVKFRNGNNEKREYAIGVGALGIDATLEGPFKKGYGGSYLFNYRYSSLALLDNLGVVDFGGVPKYQDAAFKINLPTKKFGAFSLFGMGGLSAINEVYDEKFTDAIGQGEHYSYTHTGDFDLKNNLYTVGINHLWSINKNIFVQTGISMAGNSNKEIEYLAKEGQILNGEQQVLRDSTFARHLDYQSNLGNNTLTGSLRISYKLNNHHKIEIGSKHHLIGSNYKSTYFRESTRDLFTTIDFNKSINMSRSFVAWRYRMNEHLTFVSGFHNVNLSVTGENSFEPRFSARWQQNKSGAFTLGYGRHSTMEQISNYFAKVEIDGQVTEPNKNLKLLKADHLVLGFEKRVGQNHQAKIELYHQQLYNLPVKNEVGSYYSTLNETSGFREIPLISDGKGRNYGLELTFERYLSHNFYYLFTSSIYQSKYTAKDGIERNTTFNGNYAFNALAGKEFINLGKKQNKTLAFNVKLFYVGARKIIPLLRDEQGNLQVDVVNGRYYDFSKAYQDGLDDVFQINASASLKINKSKRTHEIAIDVINANNTKARLNEYFDPSLPTKIAYDTPLALIPNVVYRVKF